MATHDEWLWYAGRDDEHYQFGPHKTRDDAIAEAKDNCCGDFQDDKGVWKLGIHLCEATNPPIPLSDWIEADWVMEQAETSLTDNDRVGSDFDEGPFFDCTPEQEKDLEAAIKLACNEWQARHNLVFTCSTFLNMRNTEYLVLDHPEGVL